MLYEESRFLRNCQGDFVICLCKVMLYYYWFIFSCQICNIKKNRLGFTIVCFCAKLIEVNSKQTFPKTT